MPRLQDYRNKRDFAKTAEPKSGKATPTRDAFVIQKHDATRLHYDLRLELGGVFKSWAVTRGPSLVAGEKRLAVHVEDHPLDYGSFEGTIPQGQYGGGTVLVWDRGTWKPVKDAKRGYAKGHLEFELQGERLKGRWHLVRIKGKPGEKRENWLLIKGDDEAARAADARDILEEFPDSVASGRSFADVVAAGAAKPEKSAKTKLPKGAKGGPLPVFVEPALATLKDKVPTGAQWLHEIKFDGYRVQARLQDGKAKLLTRTGLDWTRRFGKEIRSAIEAIPARRALIDGELVVETDAGATDFSALQEDLAAGRSDRFTFYAFDLLHLEGLDLTPAPLEERKEALRALLATADLGPRIRYSEHFVENGELVMKHACRLSLEGIISKRRDQPYRSGRGKDWVKSKCSSRQEFVIGGYVPSSTSQKAIGSLVMGYYEAGKLIHAGRVGTGFTAAVAGQLWKQLEKLRADASPFTGKLSAEARKGVRYVAPKLVAEVEFGGWTGDKHLRHAAFRGLREDKAPEEIVREDQAMAVSVPRRSSAIKLTHPDRVYWPDAGVTKEGLADYYALVWKRMAPFIVARPLALLRCPDGVGGSQTFFQKHAWRGMNSAIKVVPDPADPKGEGLLTIQDLDGLIALAQAATLEIHPWGAPANAIETPDTLIFDLDPGEGITWEDLISAAGEVRQRLTDVDLTGFAKTSGGKGLHVVVPLVPKAAWPEAKAFTKAMAEAMARDAPDRFVSTVTKAKRHGKIFIDYLRNGRGSTAVAPFSTRARVGAPVSMPVAWSELTPEIGPAHFTVPNAATRLAHMGEPWAGYRAAAKPLPKLKSR
jgi:bifunctional non-homologous end joining protein LigD